MTAAVPRWPPTWPNWPATGTETTAAASPSPRPTWKPFSPSADIGPAMLTVAGIADRCEIMPTRRYGPGHPFGPGARPVRDEPASRFLLGARAHSGPCPAGGPPPLPQGPTRHQSFLQPSQLCFLEYCRLG